MPLPVSLVDNDSLVLSKQENFCGLQSMVMSNIPLISLVLAVRNEVSFIERALQSLTTQETEHFEIEVLVVDGRSTDGTRKRIEEFARQDSRVRLIDNARQKTPFAFNIGLREARGEYVCIMGAHCEYDRNYIATCFEELKRTGAVGCSGKVLTRAASEKWQARLVARVLGHPFGTSGNSVRNQREGFQNTIPYPLFVRQVLIEMGGYDEQLFRNQDNDMNQRLHSAGYTLYLTERVSVRYYQKQTLPDVMAYAFRTGFWNWITWRKNADSMRLHHFVPGLFVLGMFSSILGAAAWIAVMSPTTRWYGVLPFVTLLAMHLGVGTVFALQELWNSRDSVAVALPLSWLTLHCAYGLGTFWAAVSNAALPATCASVESTNPQI